MNKILIVDDEREMRQLLRIYLQQENYLIEEAQNGKEAYEQILNNDFDLVILDVMMPIMDGWETIERVRKVSSVPIILLTAKSAVEDKVLGLTTGADDYLVKPFDDAELLARVKALLRRTQKASTNNDVLKYKGIILNKIARSVMYQEFVINLTQTEFDLLEVLIEHKGNALTRDHLVDLIWGIDFMGEDRTIDSHIKNLREKLNAYGIEKTFIKTIWGIGYKVE
ncbi:response regulator transcription factor [Neobacillus sp. PS3-12]|jgi:two-component system, OmpR family, response regulator ResD|uniref:response regulator transcription factor n=1 Tax=Neobacillus sp. PS3-12 TaxID=3070677 RepID=UPI0027DEDB06|nr:response regulator transcription factor [Neobacillus sp. PS3-12]WML51460.1 response regulator transcription factor [Neobacillus sp. PS3-12]